MSTFTKQAAQAARNLRAEAKRTLSRAAMLKNPAVKAAFESFPPNQRRQVSMHVSSYSNTVHISTTVRGLESFKVPKLTCLLERFIDWEATVSDYVYSDAPNKDFKFTKKVPGHGIYAQGAPVEILATIYAYVKSDSPLCRIVVTGVTERVVREEVKQIVCA
jgi:hypothetical protein